MQHRPIWLQTRSKDEVWKQYGGGFRDGISLCDYCTKWTSGRKKWDERSLWFRLTGVPAGWHWIVIVWLCHLYSTPIKLSWMPYKLGPMEWHELMTIAGRKVVEESSNPVFTNDWEKPLKKTPNHVNRHPGSNQIPPECEFRTFTTEPSHSVTNQKDLSLVFGMAHLAPWNQMGN